MTDSLEREPTLVPSRTPYKLGLPEKTKTASMVELVRSTLRQEQDP